MLGTTDGSSSANWCFRMALQALEELFVFSSAEMASQVSPAASDSNQTPAAAACSCNIVWCT